MKKILFAVAISLFIAGSAGAATVTDVYTNDNMRIDNVFEVSGIITFVTETYADNTLILYPSHDGYAIVHENENGTYQYFDKFIKPSNGDVASECVNLMFFVTNSTDHSWSDYHFEFWDTGFENRLTAVGLLNINYYMNGIFDQEEWNGENNVFTFWSDTKRQNPGDLNFFWLQIGLGGNMEDGFGIRQVATTVPIPAAVWLFGSGLIGLVAVRRRKNNL